MQPVAWKMYEVDGEIVYRIQFNEVPWKYKKSLLEAMKDWEAGAYGWHKISGNQIYTFSKKFKNLEEWTKWAESFPLQIKEKRVWGDKEKIILHGKNRTKNV